VRVKKHDRRNNRIILTSSGRDETDLEVFGRTLEEALNDREGYGGGHIEPYGNIRANFDYRIQFDPARQVFAVQKMDVWKKPTGESGEFVPLGSVWKPPTVPDFDRMR
jgi:hypothetical protein